jgi:hypothetical protein
LGPLARPMKRHKLPGNFAGWPKLECVKMECPRDIVDLDQSDNGVRWRKFHEFEEAR